MSKVRGGLSAFQRWFGNSVVRDQEGKPLLTYRGEHGEPGKEMLQTKLPSITFTDGAEGASTYAMEPNDWRDTPIAPRVTPAYLKIERPIINKLESQWVDPFVEFSELHDKLDPELLQILARRHAGHIQNTGNWDNNFSKKYPDVDALLRDDPKKINELYMDAYPLLDDPDFVSAAKKRGYDGGIHAGTGETSDDMEFRIFDPSQARSPFMKYATGGMAAVRREQGRIKDINRASPAEEMLYDKRYRNFLEDYDSLYATRPVGGTDQYRLPEIPRFAEGGGTSDWNGTEAERAAAGAAIGEAFNAGNEAIASMGGLEQFGSEGYYGEGAGSGGQNWGQWSPDEPGYTGVAGDILGGMGVGAPEAYYTGSPSGMLGADLYSGTSIANQDIDTAAVNDQDGSLYGGNRMDPSSTGFSSPFTENLANVAAASSFTPSPVDEFAGQNMRGVNFDFGYNTPTGAPAGAQPMSYDSSVVSTPYGYAGTPEFDEAFSVLGPNGMATPVDRSMGTVLGQHAGYGFDPRSAYAPGMGATTFQDWSTVPEVPAAPAPTDVPADPMVADRDLRSGAARVQESAIGPYTTDLKGMSPQGVRNLAALAANEASPIARSIARAEGIPLQEAMQKAYGHVIETVMNRSTLGRVGFGGQIYDQPLEQVMNQRAQFSGVPGTFGAGRTPGRVNELPASPADISATMANLNRIEDGRRSYPNALDFANATIPEVRAKEWVSDMLKQPDTVRVGYGPGSHWVGNVNDRRVNDYSISLPDMSSYYNAPNSRPYGATPANSRSIVGELFGINPAMAAEPVAGRGTNPYSDLPAEDGPLGDQYADEAGAIYGNMSLPPEAPRSFEFSPIQEDTTSRSRARDPMTNERFSEYGNRLALGLNNVASAMNPAQPPSAIEEVPAVPDTPVPQAPPGSQYAYADVPMPPERPEEFYNLDVVDGVRRDIAAAERPANDITVSKPAGTAVAAAAEPEYNRIPESVVKHGVNAVVGMVPFAGPVNTLAGLFGYSAGDMMAKGKPSYDPLQPGLGAGYDQYGRPVAPGPAPSGGFTQLASAGPAAAPTPTPVNPGVTMRSYLGLDDPRTYGMRPQQALFAARGGLARSKDR